MLHTRIPEVLEAELKQLATSLRVPVSNLVRTILQDAIEAAELVGRAAEVELRGAADRLAQGRERLQSAAADRGAQLGRSVGRRRAPARAPGPKPTEVPEAQAPLETDAAFFEGVLGYQPFALALETRCARCNKQLEVGETAYLGVRDAPGPRVIIGPECLPRAQR